MIIAMRLYVEICPGLHLCGCCGYNFTKFVLLIIQIRLKKSFSWFILGCQTTNVTCANICCDHFFRNRLNLSRICYQICITVDQLPVRWAPYGYMEYHKSNVIFWQPFTAGIQLYFFNIDIHMHCWYMRLCLVLLWCNSKAYEVRDLFPWKMLTKTVISCFLNVEKIWNSTQINLSST